MARLSPILRSIGGNDGAVRVGFWCPGCDGLHAVKVQQDAATPHPCWTYNGNPEKPTFTPSILVTSGRRVDPAYVAEEGDPPEVCHSFVTDGRIQFLGDCTHALAGQTVDLPAWGFEYGGTED